jgi:hypothetical protein
MAAALRLVGMRTRYDAIVHDSWARSGRIPDQQRARLELPDGTTIAVRNGTNRGPLRRSMDVTLRVAGRRCHYDHTTAQSADLHRDGSRIAAAFTGSARRSAGARRCAVAAGVDVDIMAACDSTDDLVIAMLVALCGPPGRPGAVRRIAGALWWDLNNP